MSSAPPRKEAAPVQDPRAESLTRLRNAFAQFAADLLRDPPGVPRPYQAAPPFSTMTVGDWREAVRLWRSEADGLLRTVPERACPACGGRDSRFLFVSYDAHPFHECDACRCWFVPRHVDWALFERFFERRPEARDHAARMMGDRNDDAHREADLGRIGGYLDELLPLLPAREGQRTYLDTGCGVGHSLRAGLARGFSVQGVEVDPAALRLARDAGLPVAAPGEPLAGAPYDLLSFWETLEHIADPLQVLGRFVPLLADDGLVAITVPNLASPAALVLRESCSWVHGGYNTPGHINLFHRPALERLLARAGLSVIIAEGQYSNDPMELAAFLGGATRGAFDALAPPAAATVGVADDVRAALMSVWPGVALVERMALASPILRVVACRRGREPVFAAACARHVEASRDAIAREAERLLAYESRYEQLQRDLATLRAKYRRTLRGRIDEARAQGRFTFLKPFAGLFRRPR